MSDYESVRGKIKVFVFEEDSTEREKLIFVLDKIEHLLVHDKKWHLDDYYDISLKYDLKLNTFTARRYINSETDLYEKVVVGKNKFGIILEKNHYDPDNGFCDLIETAEKDVYEFDTRFYNGGTCLSQMLEGAL